MSWIVCRLMDKCTVVSCFQPQHSCHRCRSVLPGGWTLTPHPRTSKEPRSGRRGWSADFCEKHGRQDSTATPAPAVCLTVGSCRFYRRSGMSFQFSSRGKTQTLPGSDVKNLLTLFYSCFPKKSHFSSQISKWPIFSNLHLDVINAHFVYHSTLKQALILNPPPNDVSAK